MSTIVLTFLFFAVSVLVMVIGVLVTGRSLKGSCGGPNCDCVVEGQDIGSCDRNGKSMLPVHPSDS